MITKHTKETVGYSKGHPKEHCGICKSFIAPHNCKKVEGTIEASMWCRLYTKLEKSDGD